MLPFEDRTLGDILQEPSIAPIAPHAIKGMDLSRESWYVKTLTQLRQ